MERQPEELSDNSVRKGLANLGLEVAEINYAAVGFGDHHWHVTDVSGTRWFATVADLENKPHCGDGPTATFIRLSSAMNTAVQLREAGLEFVVAPFGTPVIKLEERYALSVFPTVEGMSGDFGQEIAASDCVLIQELLARLHCTKIKAPRLSIDPPTFRTDHVWSDGPYAKPAKMLIDQHEEMIRERFEELNDLSDFVQGTEMVVTHGEPHPGNLIWGASSLHLVDWDTVGAAIPERDLSVLTDDPTELTRYQDLTGYTPSAEALQLYRLRWRLNDLIEFVDWFRAPHTDDADTKLAWTSFQETLAAL